MKSLELRNKYHKFGEKEQAKLKKTQFIGYFQVRQLNLIKAKNSIRKIFSANRCDLPEWELNW